MRAPGPVPGCSLLAGFWPNAQGSVWPGVRDFILFRDFYLLYGFIAILVVALIGNLLPGSFEPGFAGQPIAHSDGLGIFGMMLAGSCSVLLGCPQAA